MVFETGESLKIDSWQMDNNTPLSSQNWPSNKRIISKMQEQIDANLGVNVWNMLTQNDAQKPVCAMLN